MLKSYSTQPYLGKGLKVLEVFLQDTRARDTGCCALDFLGLGTLWFTPLHLPGTLEKGGKVESESPERQAHDHMQG